MTAGTSFGVWRNAALWAATAAVCYGQSRLAEASLDQLLNLPVTSVSKKEQKLRRAAAAIFVLTQEDIRRSGATNIPDLLRLVPGVEVARINANAWSIGIRGFMSRYANKVLVLVDGRSVYTPTFSGVFWEHLDQPLENIDRIEVIRGPGSTLWGANAVNGVINIITKSSKVTEGGLVSAAGGSEVHADETVQYGAPVGRSGSYRAFGKYSNTAGSILADGTDGGDGWNRLHGGFRSDWELSPRDSLMVEGDMFSNREGGTLRPGFIAAPGDRLSTESFAATGGNLVARWNHTFSGGSDMTFQTYADTYRRSELGIPEKDTTLDFDFQHHLAVGRHDIVWGSGFRTTRSGLAPGYPYGLAEPFRTDYLASAFVQDEMRLGGNVWLTLGSKFEHNSSTGFEGEPGARLVWVPSEHNALWASASRAIRQPARVDTGVQTELASIPLGFATMTVQLSGNPRLQAEESRDYEAGYRAQLSSKASLDFAGFLTYYRRLETLDPGTPQLLFVPSGLQVILPVTFGNGGGSRNYGGEVAGNWNVTGAWRIGPSYSFVQTDPRVAASAAPGTELGVLVEVPKHTVQFRSFWNVTRRLQFDQTLSWTLDGVRNPPSGTTHLPGSALPAHARLDARLSRKFGEAMEISFVGQNLLRPGIVEVSDAFRMIGTEAQRSIYGKVTWTF